MRIAILGIAMMLFACNNDQGAKTQSETSAADSIKTSTPQQPSSNTPPVEITYSITDERENTFGYYIFFDGNMVHSFPPTPNYAYEKGFKTREDADKAAQIALNKIRKGQMPPTVTEEELREAGIIR